MCNGKNARIKELESIIELNSQLIDERVSIKGMVHEKTNPYFKVIKTSYICENCGTVIEILQPKEKALYGQKRPISCLECESNIFRRLKGSFKYKLVEEIILRDAFQKEELYHFPLTVKILLEDNLVDSVSCGELVKIQGLMKLEVMGDDKFQPIIVAEEIQTINYLDEIEITNEDQEAIIELSEQDDIHDMIMESVAPSIVGYDHIKKPLPSNFSAVPIKSLITEFLGVILIS